MFSYIRFMASTRMLTSLIHIELIFVQCDRHRYAFLLHAAIEFNQYYLLKMLSFLQCVTFTSVPKT